MGYVFSECLNESCDLTLDDLQDLGQGAAEAARDKAVAAKAAAARAAAAAAKAAAAKAAAAAAAAAAATGASTRPSQVGLPRGTWITWVGRYPGTTKPNALYNLSQDAVIANKWGIPLNSSGYVTVNTVGSLLGSVGGTRHVRDGEVVPPGEAIPTYTRILVHSGTLVTVA